MKEQWNHEGNCKKCRKQKYCNNQCKAKKKYDQIIIMKAIDDKTGLVSLLDKIDTGI